MGVVKLFVGMDNLRVGGDDPPVEGQVPIRHGRACVIQAIEGDGAVIGGPQVGGDGGELVDDPDRKGFG